MPDDENMEVKTVEVDVRGIRRCQNEECEVRMNRDYNAAMNIRQNLIYWMEHEGTFNPLFQRSTTPKGEDRLTRVPRGPITRKQ